MIKQAWISRSQDENKLFHDLKVLILSYCIYLAKSPDFSLFPHLERLDLGNCRSLDNLDDSIGQLSQLKILILKCCVSLKRLPDSIGDLKSLVQLDLSGLGIEELPDTISKLIFLEEMNIRDCRSLEKFPDGVGLLEKLVILDADSCDNLVKLPTSMRRMTCLRRINLKGDGISNIPDDFSMLLNLMELKMTATLQSLPIDLSHWRYLKQLNLFKCVKLEYLPKLPLSLVELCCEDCFSLVQLPDLSLLNILAILCLEGCVNLEEIRGLEGKLSLVEVNARGCHNLTIPPRKILGQGTLLPDRPLGSFSLTAIDGIYKKRLILCLVLELPSDFRSQTIYCDISASIRQRGKTTSCVHTLRIEDVEFTTHPHIIYLHHFKGFDWFGIPLHGKDAIENLHIHQSNLRHQLSLDTDASRAYCRVKFWKLLLENMEPFQQERNRHSIAMMVAEFFIWKFENRESEQENHNRHSSDKLMAADFSNWSFENREYEHQMLNQHSSAMRVADFFDCPYVGVGGSRATARLVLENEEDEEDEAACPSPGQETETETETGLSSNGSILIDSDDDVLLTAIARIVLENEEEEGVSRAMERLFLRKDDDASVVC
ncbi:uncharacterized protein LOC122077777 [Macadamia integrifolia]|uniref:uncharacterized protein LOC122077777 n=1 Tax=Macadamia integrifolia TaxID=60698 RepID=UPI001C4E8086|nr:uncharacterized protein LOC122077777 [Macadamia integrifolia]